MDSDPSELGQPEDRRGGRHITTNPFTAAAGDTVENGRTDADDDVAKSNRMRHLT